MERKQKNKPFKGKSKATHRKGGRVSGQSIKAQARSSATQSRLDRRNSTKQRLQQQRQDLVASRRQALHPEYVPKNPPPQLVAVMPLSAAAPYQLVASVLVQSADTFTSPRTVSVPEWKSRLTVVPLPREGIDDILEVTKAADDIILVATVNDEVDGDLISKQMITAIKAQGMPSVILVVTGLENIPIKKQSAVKKGLVDRCHFHFTDAAKVVFLNPEAAKDRNALRRLVCQIRTRSVKWREVRSNLFVDGAEYDSSCPPTAASDNNTAAHFSTFPHLFNPGEPLGTLLLRGYVRQGGLSCHHLMHLTRLGCYRVKRIAVHADPLTNEGKELQVERVVEADESAVDELRMENNTEVENGQEAGASSSALAQQTVVGQVGKRVPVGTSAYQSTWIMESGGEEEDDSDEERQDGGDLMMGDGSSDEGEEVHMGEGSGDAEPEEDYEWLNLVKDADTLDAEEKRRQAQEEFEFPDEVETPIDQPARVRFIKYSALKSLRKTPWDPKKNNTPAEYAKVFQFSSFNRVKKRVLASVQERSGEDVVPEGSYVTVALEGVPMGYLAALQAQAVSPVLLGFSMLRHENRLSVLQLNVKKHPSFEDVIKSKESLEVHMGPRQFMCRPLFSENSFNCDKHKYLRFLPAGANCIASIYAPVMFPPVPVLMFRVGENSEKRLVATGTLESADPNRVVLKKISLTGYPVRVHKNKAIIREMFYFPDDIRWYKPVELRSKHKRVGHIVEPLGTHGLMKCTFDGNMTQSDTILMNMYKRVYPVSWEPKPPASQDVTMH